MTSMTHLSNRESKLYNKIFQLQLDKPDLRTLLSKHAYGDVMVSHGVAPGHLHASHVGMEVNETRGK